MSNELNLGLFQTPCSQICGMFFQISEICCSLGKKKRVARRISYVDLLIAIQWKCKIISTAEWLYIWKASKVCNLFLHNIYPPENVIVKCFSLNNFCKFSGWQKQSTRVELRKFLNYHHIWLAICWIFRT